MSHSSRCNAVQFFRMQGLNGVGKTFEPDVNCLYYEKTYFLSDRLPAFAMTNIVLAFQISQT